MPLILSLNFLFQFDLTVYSLIVRKNESLSQWSWGKRKWNRYHCCLIANQAQNYQKAIVWQYTDKFNLHWFSFNFWQFQYSTARQYHKQISLLHLLISFETVFSKNRFNSKSITSIWYQHLFLNLWSYQKFNRSWVSFLSDLGVGRTCSWYSWQCVLLDWWWGWYSLLWPPYICICKIRQIEI